MSKITELHQKAIDEIMDNFDFRWCYEAMKATKWTWADVEGHVLESDLRSSARSKLKEVIEKDCYLISSGGLTIVYDKDRESDNYPFFLQLFFGRELIA